MEQEKQRMYFKRLGLTQTDTTVGEEQLNAIIRAHLEKIPFENLDVCDFHKVPALDPDSLFEKIITGRRGGYCFELNRLLLALLESLGYEVHPVAVRVMWNRTVLPPTTHMGIIAQCDGKHYYCDVGYGGPGPKGLLRLTPESQTICGEQFRVTQAGLPEQSDVQPETPECYAARIEASERSTARHGFTEYKIEKDYHGEWKAVLQFEDHPCRPVDFEPLNFYCAKNPAVLFTQKRVLYLYMPNGWKSLMDMELTISENGEITKTVYHQKEQLEQGLLEEFGIQISLP
ncbi:MAG: arylamine N-acetyltransferase [Lachnospiraceae bacterium]|nr:arylamine N-acetyltransferase [Lachnospiraceae bacterium]